jgi:hypothetical protein
MQVEIKGDNLVITIPLDKKGKISESGKTMINATSHGGVKTNVEVNGKPLTVSVNAYTPNPEFKKQKATA